MPRWLKLILGILGALGITVPHLLAAFDAVDWSESQTLLVVAEVEAVTGLVSAVVAHFWRGTKEEPVAISAALTAFLTATGALVTGFGWWDLTEEQIAALLSVCTALVAAVAAAVARSEVTAARTGQ
jgi:hypothetical protein